MAVWFREILKIDQCEQRQDSLDEQLRTLAVVANKLGCQDAADYIFKILYTKSK